jgi:hypothetical protein
MRNFCLLLVLVCGTKALAQVGLEQPRPLPGTLPDATPRGDSPLGPAPVPRPGPAPAPNPLIIQPPGSVPPPTIVDPFDGPPSLLPSIREEGWYVVNDAFLVIPTLSNQLPSTAPFRVPQVGLDNSYGFRTEVGYRFAEEEGLVALSYRVLNAEGNGVVDQGGLSLQTKTRVATNMFDLDFGVTPYEVAARTTVSWRIGGRLASIYFDSRGVNGNYVQQGSNNYLGSGVHGLFEVEQRISFVEGLSIFGRADGAFMIGETQQRYRTELGSSVALLTDREQRNVPMVNAQVGLNYRVPSLPGMSFSLGYTYEQWFRVGSLGLAGDGTIATSNGTFSWHGAFLRGQFDF